MKEQSLENMAITVRKAISEDFDSLSALFQEIDTLHRDHLPSIFQAPNGPSRDQKFYLELLSNLDIGLFVAQSNQQLVGAIQANIKASYQLPIFVPRKYMVVDNIVVKSEFRKHGVGQRLMNYVEDWSREMGVTSIELNVYEFNGAAIGFYSKLGYQTLSRKMSKDL